MIKDCSEHVLSLLFRNTVVLIVTLGHNHSNKKQLLWRSWF